MFPEIIMIELPIRGGISATSRNATGRPIALVDRNAVLAHTPSAAIRT